MKSKLFYVLVGAATAVLFSIAIMASANGASHSAASANSNQSAVPAASTQLKSSLGTIDFGSFSHSPASTTASDSVKRCQIIHWIGNRVYTINSSMNMATHFVFPEQAIDVVVGNKDLWTEEHTANHVFVKPNTNKDEGAETTLTYIGSDTGNSYEFILKRVADSDATTCVVISRNGGMINSTAWNNYQNRDKHIIQFLANQFQEQKNQIISQQQNALDRYRGMIYTGYQWKAKGGWFGKNFVSDVYDDGRWTYIRVNQDNKGVMSIYGVLDGKKDILQFSYDEVTKMYRVSGIYPQLILAYGKNIVIINRQSA